MNNGAFAPARTINRPREKFISHCNKGLNAKFTLLNNSALRLFLRNRINCAAIVRP
jgi:hypothetical protein